MFPVWMYVRSDARPFAASTCTNASIGSVRVPRTLMPRSNATHDVGWPGLGVVDGLASRMPVAKDQ